jgi:hypothetical protein
MSGFAEVFVEFKPTSQGGRSSPVYLGEDAVPHYMPRFVVHDGGPTHLGVEFVHGADDAVKPGDAAYATVRFMDKPEVS